MVARKNVKQFELQNSEFETFWGEGATPEEAVASAIADGCEFTGEIEVFEMTNVGKYTLEKKTVATKIKK